MIKILIVIENGILSSVIADHSEISYIAVDHDPKGDEPVIISQICTPEIVPPGKLKEHFTGDDYLSIQIHDTLGQLDY
jgi:hypothetical protein